MEQHKHSDVLAANLRERRQFYTSLLERSRNWYGRRDDISLDALNELADALEELSVAEEELRAQNDALLSASELVEQERQHYLELFDTLPDAYVITDAKGVIREANPASAALFNVEPRRLPGKPLAVFVADAEKRRFRAFMNDAMERPGPLDFEGMIRPRQSPPKVISVRLSKIGDAPPRIGWSIRDLSNRPEIGRYAERVETEHAARVAAEQAARRFRFLAEVGRALTAARDRETMTGDVARAVVRFAADHCSFYFIEEGALVSLARRDHDGVQPEIVDALKRRYQMEVTDVDSPIWQTILTGAPHTIPQLHAKVEDLRWKELFDEIRDRGPRNAVVLPLLRRDHCFGAMLVMSATPAPTITAEDIGVLLETATRVSLALENAELIEKLQAANREKTDFLRVVSHELRTPLTAVIGYADLMLAGIPDQLGLTAREYVERVRTSAWHQLAIVEQLLTQAQPGQPDNVKHESVELACIIQEACDAIITATTEKGLKLDLDVPPAIRLHTDPDRLRQILINLLWNAVKYTDLGGLGVRVRGSDDRVFISVADTGPGIPPDALERVFEPYWRASDRSPGLGLGLSVSRKLARLLGGELTVESETGAGSTFTLSLKTE